jgi:hypothetical protein
VFGQNFDPDTRQLIQSLLSRIDGLEKRVAELEQDKIAATSHPAPSPPGNGGPTANVVSMSALSQAGPQPAHDHDQAPVPEAAQPSYPLLKISGFSDVNFSANDSHVPITGFSPQTYLQPHSGFSEGQFVLHMSSALSSKVSVFGELTFTARQDAGTGSPAAPGFNAEVERVIIRYDLNDYFKLSFGRYHTPINYWNTAFHHGAWLQTTISRPEMTQFGGSFIPVHFVGALAEGAIPAGGMNLNYDFGVGNGRGQVLSRDGDLGDVNNNRAWLVNGFVKPDSLFGLQAGASVYRDKLNPIGVPGAREWIRSAHIVWARETPEIIAEFSDVEHQPIGAGVVSHSQAFYAQLAYRFPFNAKKWKPYYRFEHMHIPLSDYIFKTVPTFAASTAGIRYDITNFAAFKVEYRHYDIRNIPQFNGIFAQTAFTF